MSLTLKQVQASAQRSIVGAVKKEDTEHLKYLLTLGNVYGHDDLARALQVACDKGLDECVEILLEANAMPNIHDISGFTPLIYAAKKGNSRCLRLLAKAKGVNINKVTHRVRASALHWASTNGHLTCVKILLDNGANIEGKTIHGRTSLMLASRSDHDDVVQELIDRGAYVNVPELHQATALHLAAEEGSDDSVRALIKAKADVNMQMKDGDTAVMLAAKKGHHEVVRRLIRADCDLTLFGHQLNALHWAADGGNPACVELLLKQGLHPSIPTPEGYFGATFVMSGNTTTLMLACRKGHVEVVEVLLKAGAFTEQLDMEGNSALIYAIKGHFSRCVDLLIKYGAHPDGVKLSMSPFADYSLSEAGLDEIAMSPLFVAIKENSSEALKILLKANCNLNVMATLSDGDLLTPFELALIKGSLTTAKMLLLAGIDKGVVNMNFVEETMAWLVAEDPDTYLWLFNQLTSTPPLMQLARNRIRQALRRRIAQVDTLPLPVPLVKYVNLSDIEDL